jgi:hypothetical protein
LVAVVASDDDLSLLCVVWLFGCVLNSDDSDDRVTEINICFGVVFCFVIRVGKKVSDSSKIVICQIKIGETRSRKKSRVLSSVEIEHRQSVHLQCHVADRKKLMQYHF